MNEVFLRGLILTSKVTSSSYKMHVASRLPPQGTPGPYSARWGRRAKGQCVCPTRRPMGARILYSAASPLLPSHLRVIRGDYYMTVSVTMEAAAAAHPGRGDCQNVRSALDSHACALAFPRARFTERRTRGRWQLVGESRRRPRD